MWLEILLVDGFRFALADNVEEYVEREGAAQLRPVTDPATIAALDASWAAANPQPDLHDDARMQPFIDGDDCWQCGGSGVIVSCQDEGACLHPDDGCELCTRICRECCRAGEAI